MSWYSGTDDDLDLSKLVVSTGPLAASGFEALRTTIRTAGVAHYKTVAYRM